LRDDTIIFTAGGRFRWYCVTARKGVAFFRGVSVTTRYRLRGVGGVVIKYYTIMEIWKLGYYIRIKEKIP
jgi:hypothetical protein